jgi:hypothetical protein
MSCTLSQEQFKGWPAFALRQEGIILRVVPSVGGRLMSVEVQGHELCFTHVPLEGREFHGDESQWPLLCGDWSFPLWGGGKTWIAPESRWPGGAPHRDLDSRPWQVQRVWIDAKGMGIAVQSPVCSESGLQLTRRLCWPRGSREWTVTHTVRNTGRQSIQCGLWDVLMLKRPGLVEIPLPVAPGAGNALAAIRSLPDRTPLDDLLHEGIVQASQTQATVHCVSARAFKCGFASESGALRVTFPSSGVRYARLSEVAPAAAYAHGQPLEIFNAPQLEYFEVETHSPMQQLEPGASYHYAIHERVDSM